MYFSRYHTKLLILSKMQIKVERIDQDFQMEATNEDGHTVTLDGGLRL